MEESDSREGFGRWSPNQSPMEVRNMITDAGADFTRESSRDAWNAAPQTSQSREQSQNALLVQAARATMEFQQLQWDCQALNCGLSDSTYESLVETCRALPTLFPYTTLFRSRKSVV